MLTVAFMEDVGPSSALEDHPLMPFFREMDTDGSETITIEEVRWNCKLIFQKLELKNICSYKKMEHILFHHEVSPLTLFFVF